MSPKEYLYKGTTKVVKEFDLDNSDSLFATLKAPRVVEFYDPHCPACAAYRPHYISLAEETQKLHPEILFFAVSCEKHEGVCDEYNVEGYPTLRFFQKDDIGPHDQGFEHEDENDEEPDEITVARVIDFLNVTPNGKKESKVSLSKAISSPPPSSQKEISSESSTRYAEIYKAEKERYYKEQQKRQGFGKFLRKDDQDISTREEKVSYNEMTTGMKSNMLGTDEFEKRQEVYQIVLDRKKGSSKRLAHASYLLKKVDTKRSYWFSSKMSPEEELIYDATLSLLVGVESGLSKAMTDPIAKSAMQNWLKLLSVSLPSEWDVHRPIHALSMALEDDSLSDDPQTLKNWLRRYYSPSQKDEGWTDSCQNKELQTDGFTCGFWKLLHIVTLGIAEYRGTKNLIDRQRRYSERTKVFSPSLAADTIRNYIEHFFTCKPCRKHFLQTYDDCHKNQRCQRLADNGNDDTSPQHWKELSLWLWEFHNDVSVRLLRERSSKNSSSPPTLANEVAIIFPTVNSCPLCLDDNGLWNKAQVFRFLERTYWPDSHTDPLTDKLLQLEGVQTTTNWKLPSIIVFVALLIVGKLFGRRILGRFTTKSRTV